MAKQEKYKYKSLRCYQYADRIYFNKPYRSVFIGPEADWINVELTFYNLLFDEKNWNCKIRLQCFKITDGLNDKIFDDEYEIEVNTDQNIVSFSEGWGNENKTFS